MTRVSPPHGASLIARWPQVPAVAETLNKVAPHLCDADHVMLDPVRSVDNTQQRVDWTDLSLPASRTDLSVRPDMTRPCRLVTSRGLPVSVCCTYPDVSPACPSWVMPKGEIGG